MPIPPVCSNIAAVIFPFFPWTMVFFTLLDLSYHHNNLLSILLIIFLSNSTYSFGYHLSVFLFSETLLESVFYTQYHSFSCHFILSWAHSVFYPYYFTDTALSNIISHLHMTRSNGPLVLNSLCLLVISATFCLETHSSLTLRTPPPHVFLAFHLPLLPRLL